MNQLEIADHFHALIQLIGDDPARDGLVETPERVSRAWTELFGGYDQNPEMHLKWFEDDTDEMIISTGLNVYSMCEHHMLPFFGRAAIGYIPQGKVLGASKMARITDVFARRLQIQERLTRQIGEILEPQVLGVAVSITAQHLCMVSRGVNQQDSHLTTNYLTGPFQDSPQTRAEFFAAVRG
jgi:GTP cyclohydrolase I